MKKIEHMKRYMKRSFLLLPALLLACALTASAEVLPGTNYGKIAIGANEVTMNGSYIGATGAELYIPVTETNHGSLVIEGTATGSTQIVLNNLPNTWDGTSIDLVEAADEGSSAEAFTMEVATAATSGKKAILRSRVEEEKRIWYITLGTELDLTVFLQGPTAEDGFMTNYIQTADPDNSYFISGPQLPVTDPYGTGAKYEGINANAETFPVVDWILVEIWTIGDISDPSTKEIKESQALLLKPNGSVVDALDNAPVFASQEGSVYVVVKHRNHMGIMSHPIPNFKTETAEYNFSDKEEKAFKVNTEDYIPVVYRNGRWCMYAGDFSGVGMVTDADYSATSAAAVNFLYDAYMAPDINMNGFVDDEDFSIIKANAESFRYSPLMYLY